MNERIKELAKQAGNKRINDYYTNGTVTAFSDEQLQKFAELIVRECAGLPVEEPKREWVWLTQEDFVEISRPYTESFNSGSPDWFDVLKYTGAVEAKLKEKNA